jgi:hypothetical protein
MLPGRVRYAFLGYEVPPPQALSIHDFPKPRSERLFLICVTLSSVRLHEAVVEKGVDVLECVTGSFILTFCGELNVTNRYSPYSISEVL